MASEQMNGSSHASIAEARLAEQRLVDGKLFPLVLSPSAPLQSSDDALALLHASRGFLEQKLQEHGVLYLRGFPLHSASHFHSSVEALGWPCLPYLGSAPRTQVVDSVYTANDTDPDIPIEFHHEMAQVVDSSALPSKVVFFCETPPAKGGSTPITMSHKVTEGLWKECPEFMRKLEQLGLLYLKVLPMEKDHSHISGQAWPVVFGTADRKEVEERAAEQFNAKVEWLPGDKLKLVAGPFQATRNFGQEGVDAWFNMVMVYHSGLSHGLNLSSDSSHPFDVVFGDGSPLPQDAVDICRRLHEDYSVDMPWQKGDVMIVNNHTVMHGRRPYKRPRQILVSLCK